jgi:hypothetical protein
MGKSGKDFDMCMINEKPVKYEEKLNDYMQRMWISRGMKCESEGRRDAE